MKTRGKIFSRGIASGEGFCNRTAETALLVKNMEDVTHTLLMSPRRHGKTSLVLRSIEKSRFPHAYIDLFMKYEEEIILDEFYLEVGRLLSKLIKPTEKALKKLGGLLKHLSVNLHYGEFGFEFRLEPKFASEKRSIKQLLMGLDSYLEKQNKKVVIFIDEMQTIVDSKICSEIESSLRFIAQKTTNITFIFAGSSRHLMGQLFEERSRPFYKLCQKMVIERMSEQHYRKFISKHAIRRWGSNFDDSVYTEIFSVTQMHPYYMNVLCGYLFDLDSTITEKNVRECWSEICIEEQGAIARDIDFLTQNQKIVLSEIARTSDIIKPTGKEFSNRVNLSPRGVTLAINVLMEHDLIEKFESGKYRVTDPIIAYWVMVHQ